jgi:AAA+ ATPase superfamily predicted ATPase
LAKYLHVLEKLEVVRREVPVLGKARPIYVVSDLYIKFWARLVHPRETGSSSATPRGWIQTATWPQPTKRWCAAPCLTYIRQAG